MKKIILIGGAPMSGKTTLAKQLSDKLKLPIISTDQVRNFIKPYSKELNLDYLPAKEYFSQYSAYEICEREYRQAELLHQGIKNFIEKDYVWESGFIIEGVGILPKLVTDSFVRNRPTYSFFIEQPDSNVLLDRIRSRGLYDKADRYDDLFKVMEVDWVNLFAEQIKKELKNYSLTMCSASEALKVFG